MKVKIAFVQLIPEKTSAEQYETGLSACKKARAMGADITLFPEMWSCGYFIPQNITQLRALALTEQSDFVQGFRETAKKLNMAIGITFLEQNNPRPLNSIILFDRKGKKVLHYSKVHICAFDREKVLSPGGDFYVNELNTENGNLKVGSMICFDREFPESARILMLKGVELILAPNACPMEINRLSALRTRAYENMVAVATCNYPAGHPDCNGHSTLFDGVPWLPGEPDVRDMCVFNAPEEAGVYIAELDIGMLRKHRTHDIMGDKYRCPDKYSTLI